MPSAMALEPPHDGEQYPSPTNARTINPVDLEQRDASPSRGLDVNVSGRKTPTSTASEVAMTPREMASVHSEPSPTRSGMGNENTEGRVSASSHATSEHQAGHIAESHRQSSQSRTRANDGRPIIYFKNIPSRLTVQELLSTIRVPLGRLHVVDFDETRRAARVVFAEASAHNLFFEQAFQGRLPLTWAAGVIVEVDQETDWHPTPAEQMPSTTRVLQIHDLPAEEMRLNAILLDLYNADRDRPYLIEKMILGREGPDPSKQRSVVRINFASIRDAMTAQIKLEGHPIVAGKYEHARFSHGHDECSTTGDPHVWRSINVMHDGPTDARGFMIWPPTWSPSGRKERKAIDKIKRLIEGWEPEGSDPATSYNPMASANISKPNTEPMPKLSKNPAPVLRTNLGPSGPISSWTTHNVPTVPKPSSAPTGPKSLSAPTSQKAPNVPVVQKPLGAPTVPKPSSASAVSKPSSMPTGPKSLSAPVSQKASSAPTGSKSSNAPAGPKPLNAPTGPKSMSVPTGPKSLSAPKSQKGPSAPTVPKPPSSPTSQKAPSPSKSEATASSGQDTSALTAYVLRSHNHPMPPWRTFLHGIFIENIPSYINAKDLLRALSGGKIRRCFIFRPGQIVNGQYILGTACHGTVFFERQRVVDRILGYLTPRGGLFLPQTGRRYKATPYAPPQSTKARPEIFPEEATRVVSLTFENTPSNQNVTPTSVRNLIQQHVQVDIEVADIEEKIITCSPTISPSGPSLRRLTIEMNCVNEAFLVRTLLRRTPISGLVREFEFERDPCDGPLGKMK